MNVNKLSYVTAVCLAFLWASAIYAAQEGTQSPGFSLRALTGKTITLEQFRGKVVLLVFWAPWCIPCRDELPEIDRLYTKYKYKGFEVIGVSEDATQSAVDTFLKKVSVSFSIALDSGGSVAEAYRLSNLPSGYLIGRDGMIRQRYRGFDKNFVKNYEKDIFELLD